MKILWIQFDQPEGAKLPVWLRLVAIARDGSEVFLPAAIQGSEDKVSFCAAYDGATMLRKRGHVYAPASWMAKEFPDTEDLCDLAVTRAKASLRRSQNMEYDTSAPKPAKAE